MKIFQVYSEHYTAGVCVNHDGIIEDTAPILGWTKGKQWEGVSEYLNKKGCKIHECELSSILKQTDLSQH